jgi:hypothetical protein
MQQTFKSFTMKIFPGALQRLHPAAIIFGVALNTLEACK